MLLLTSTSDLLRVITSAAADIETHVDYADASGSPVAVAMGRVNTASITTATTTTILGSPAASTSRNLKAAYLRNNHASVTTDVEVIHTDGSTISSIVKVTLLPGESLHFVEGTGWLHLDSNGIVKLASTFGRASAGTADATANAADTYIPGSGLAIAGKIKAGTHITWIVSATKTGAGIATPIWNVRFGTAGTTADTSRLAFTGLAQTGVADTAMFRIEMVFRAVSASGVVSGTYALLTHRLASTGFCVQAVDCVQATSAAFDLTTANLIAGLSVNPGAAGVWTIKEVTAELTGLAGE